MSDVIAIEEEYLLQTYARPNFVIARGEGCYLIDTDGRRYLDCVAGIAVNALGYGDPQLAGVIAEHANGLLHISNLYYNTEAGALAKLMVESCPAADRVFFSNSGAEAIEGALKFGRKYSYEHYHNPQKTTIVAFTGSFHGRTMGAVAVTSREKYRAPFAPVMPNVRFATFNDLDEARQAISDDVCAVVVEPIQGEGGLSVATPAFLKLLRDRCDAVGALLIFDEIQCGMGRTGTLWAHEQYGIEPDIMTVAKPLGGGLPIGAILMRQKVADVIHAGDHGTTFGGGPFVTAVAHHVFQRLSDPALLSHVREVGDYLGESLNELASHHPEIVEIRGRGLMRGIQITGSAGAVREAAHDQGLLIATAGDDVLRLVPPLVLQREHVDEAVKKLDAALSAAG